MANMTKNCSSTAGFLCLDILKIQTLLQTQEKEAFIMHDVYLQHISTIVANLMTTLTTSLSNTRAKLSQLSMAKYDHTAQRLEGLDAHFMALSLAKADSFVQSQDPQTYANSISVTNATDTDTIPSHTTSTRSATSSRYSRGTSIATESEGEDLQDQRLIIKIPNTGQHVFNDQTPDTIVTTLNNLVHKTYDVDPPVVVSTDPLPSGDLAIFLQTSRSKDRLLDNSVDWLQQLKPRYKLQGPSRKFGVCIRNCPNFPLHTITSLLRKQYPECKITHAQFISPSTATSRGSMVIYTKSKQAQQSLHRHKFLALNGATLYVTGLHILPALQWFNCYSFDHLQRDCTNPTTCRKCSGSHTTSSCNVVPNGSTASIASLCTCPNCKEKHPGWSFTCPKHPNFRPT
jgi:hypothetical protein